MTATTDVEERDDREDKRELPSGINCDNRPPLLLLLMIINHGEEIFRHTHTKH
jgi:hypothetical protein